EGQVLVDSQVAVPAGSGADVADLLLRWPADGAAAQWQRAGERPQERRLAGAIAADDRHHLARPDLERDAPPRRVVAERHRHVGEARGRGAAGSLAAQAGRASAGRGEKRARIPGPPAGDRSRRNRMTESPKISTAMTASAAIGTTTASSGAPRTITP